ncbi:hypothetical protein PgNI_06479 [Pyricularia grisea]|uniref:Heterokaryon incompatibility domain-containing protein n=1 Tax=Pyricularia grisea TaxID=148305 RepID=A0A6P8B5V6_PYRGI|nr:hypothetical protein PgNI_06479 [Pyricularia grisea]TLD10635.1 hypothetical protein PgNI_06479 [Pyricularia grisea]
MTVAQTYHQHSVTIQQFTGRKLKMDSDALDAFRGVMRNYNTRLLPIYSLWGIPWCLHLEKDSRHDKYFLDGLAWYHQERAMQAPGLPRRRIEFPSWSWAGWEGIVFYEKRTSLYYDRNGPFDASARLASLLSKSTADFDSDETKSIVLNAAVIPADRISRSTDKPGGWDLKTKKPIKDMRLHLSCHMSEEELHDRLLGQDTVVCIEIGRIFAHHFFMVLEKRGPDDNMGYSRIGLFVAVLGSMEFGNIRSYHDGGRRDWVIY